MSNQKEDNILFNNVNFKDSYEKRNNKFIEDFIEMGKDKLRVNRNVNPVSLLICYNIQRNKYIDIVIPINEIIDNYSIELSSVIIKQMISELERNPDIKVLNHIFMMSSQIKRFKSEDYSKIKNGIEENFTQEELDSLETKDVLIVCIEDQFKTRNICYEYVEFSNGEIVINSKPFMDVTNVYDQKIADIGLFNFMLTKKVFSN